MFEGYCFQLYSHSAIYMSNFFRSDREKRLSALRNIEEESDSPRKTNPFRNQVSFVHTFLFIDRRDFIREF